MRTLIQNGRIITAVDDYMGDLLVEDGSIEAIGRRLEVAADQVIDAAGKYVLPGGVDVHTHLDYWTGTHTSADDFASGTVAAACGGTTCVVDFVEPRRGQSLLEAIEQRSAQAVGKAAVDFGFHMVVREFRAGTLAEMDRTIEEGIPSFKLFMAYSQLMLDDASIFRLMLRAANNGALIAMHAENGGVIDVLIERAIAEGRLGAAEAAFTRPAEAEAEATHRAIAMARLAGTPLYVVHVSSAAALHEIRAARDRGQPVYGETCPQYLFLDRSVYEDPEQAARYICSPPLREVTDQQDLWRGLATDDLQVVSTDHCPFCLREKYVQPFTAIPKGLPNLETRLALVHDRGVRAGRISLNRFVDLTSTRPAKLFGLFPKKGTIAIGSDADLVLFDPNRSATLGVSTLHQRVDYTPYEGWTVAGSPETVLSRGEVVVQNGQFVGRPGRGQFVKRARFGGL